MRILEELWYGNIEPMVYSTDLSNEHKEALGMISKNDCIGSGWLHG